MTVHLGILYHWSPVDRRVDIMRDGLKVYSPAPDVDDDYRRPYICLGTTPSAAWGLSGDMDWETEVEDWDLWQTQVIEGDDITIRGDFVPYVQEVRVRNSIPADRIWWVATRSPLPFVEEKKSTKKTTGRKR